DRPYRRSMSQQEALALVIAGRGTHFDPQVVDAFLAVYDTVHADIAAINGAGAGDEEPGIERAEIHRIDPRVFGDIGGARGELYALYDAMQPLGRSLDLRETLEVLVEKTSHIVEFSTCILFRACRERGELEAEIVAGLYQERFQGMTIK